MDDAGVSTDPAAEYRELVLDLVAQIPSGRVCSYGAIADAARAMTGRGSARTVGRIMALDGGSVPWWRVLPTSGVVPQHLRRRAAAHLRAEGTPLRSTDPLRVDMARARWVPPL
ncbi:MAG TPA: MGMT family protein [Beutenbergiaceae bacterium]|nr:MGMT family protein [Beutenbergiaceae bacterium]